VLKNRRSDKTKLKINVCISEFVPLNESSELVKHWFQVYNNNGRSSRIDDLHDEALLLLNKYSDNRNYVDPEYIPPVIDSTRSDVNEVAKGQLSLLRYHEEREERRDKAVKELLKINSLVLVDDDDDDDDMMLMMIMMLMTMVMMIII